ncbi:MAG: TlyA family RNA methyltransferase [Clostridia bacterium]|nr:TlyA family RNA methyltransferase [Clostridia bacterium]
MRIDLFLAENGYCKSRSKAAEAIKEGRVLVNGKPVEKPSFLVEEGMEVTLLESEEEGFVSRAGYKLEGALKTFGIHVSGMTAVDLGASTGGFTDCLLQRGAAYVYAVDVGHGQLDEKLLCDGRVCNMEKTNARYLKKEDFARPVDIVVTDVSFISQRLLYPAVADILPSGGSFVSLIKPQFEVGKQHVGKGGIVRDPSGKLFRNLLAELKAEGSNHGLKLISHADSPILGGDGNREYLAYWRKE